MWILKGIYGAGIASLFVHLGLFLAFVHAYGQYSGLDIAIYLDTAGRVCTENKEELISLIERTSSDLEKSNITDVVYHLVTTPKYKYHGATLPEDVISQIRNLPCTSKDKRNRYILYGLGKIANVAKKSQDIVPQDLELLSWRSKSRKMVLAFIRNHKDILQRYSCVLGVMYSDLNVTRVSEECKLSDLDPSVQVPNKLEDALIINEPADELDSAFNPECSTYLEQIAGNMFLYDISAVLVVESSNKEKCVTLHGNFMGGDLNFSPVEIAFGHPNLNGESIADMSDPDFVRTNTDYGTKGSLLFVAYSNNVYLRVRSLPQIFKNGLSNDFQSILRGVSDSQERTRNHYNQYVREKTSLEEAKKCKRVSDYNYECMRYIEEDTLELLDLPKGFFSVNEESYSQHDIQRNNPHFNNRLNISQDSIPYSRVTKLEKQDLSFLDKYRNSLGYIDFDDIKSPYVLGESLMHARQYGKGLNLHLEDALNEIIKYATAAFIRYNIFWTTVQYAASDRYVTYKYRALVRDVPRYFMDPLLVVPYRMMRSSRSLFKPTQKSSCPYFMLIFSHATTDSGFNTLYGSISESANIFYEFYDDACKHGTTEPLESCDLHTNPYFSYTSNATHPELLTVINLEDYYTGDSTYDRFTSKYSGVAEIFRSITGKPFLVHQYNENMPAAQFTDFPVAGRKQCALDLEKQIYGVNQDGFIGKNYWRRVIDKGRLKDSGEKIRDWWRSKADAKSGLNSKSWMSGANKTLDYIIDNQKFVGYKGNTYRRFPLKSEDSLKKEIKEDYARFIKEMEEKTGYKKRTPKLTLRTAGKPELPIEDEEEPPASPEMNFCGPEVTYDLVKNLDVVEEDIRVYE